jgi:enamine deaminase RidA (YjgF/YER057c/UK114 family)
VPRAMPHPHSFVKRACMSTPESRLAALGLTLPPAAALAAAPGAKYVPFQLHNGLLVVSGQLPMQNGEFVYKGHLGSTVSLEDAQQAARLCALNILAQAKAALGDLSRIEKTMRIAGLVACTPDFQQHPAVMNGASTLILEVLGAAGAHPRMAVGTNALPFGVCVEIEALFAVK